ncbi:hypothetical protein [Ralstonia phage RSP15]|uniref:RIIB lysis inhibitor n=1 Tax=Ralstonia phage RSP15 TaxID=1785960 RepID=UPI00074D29D4|nr:RIIB lysis inhibitor [Ralstonia phage RSP15]BAU40160.1 hypothetical protein [Ralstonia phage RSP15]
MDLITAKQVVVAHTLKDIFDISTVDIGKLLDINPRSVLRRLEKDYHQAFNILEEADIDVIGDYSYYVGNRIAEENLDDNHAEFIFDADDNGLVDSVLINETKGFIYFSTIEINTKESNTQTTATASKDDGELVDFQAIVLPSSLVVVRDGKPLAVDSKHKNFAKIRDLISANVVNNQIPVGVLADLYDLIDLKAALEEFTEGLVKVTRSGVTIAGRPLDGRLSDRLMSAVFDGHKDANTTLRGLANFVALLEQNPSHRVVSRLYDFLKANDIKINDDGMVVTLKVVKPDYKDKYTGTMDNSPGQLVSVPRNQVDDRDENTCSNGLHVCSIKYFVDGPYYRDGDTVVECLVHPKDWVSIPVDYDNSKARVCAYVVTKDITDEVPAMIKKYREAN